MIFIIRLPECEHRLSDWKAFCARLEALLISGAHAVTDAYLVPVGGVMQFTAILGGAS